MAVAVFALAATVWTRGILFWSLLGVGLMATAMFLGGASSAFLPGPAGPRFRDRFLKLTVVMFSVTVALLVAEGFLAIREKGGGALPGLTRRQRNTPRNRLALARKFGIEIKPEAEAEILKRDGVLTMPREWERADLEVPGSVRSYLWHGYLHVHSQEGFRRNTPFPDKKADTLRIMVIGDSMTYGYGVDERFTYTTLLSGKLNETHRVEVLNLGIAGWQSTDILRVLAEFLPRLHPDLVVYGMVANDFLPSQAGQYTERGFEFPISPWLEKFLKDRTRLARLASDSYAAALRSLHLRNDFYDDILRDFGGYQIRFGQDVKAMNELVTGAGLPPIIALVLDQYPAAGGKGMKIARDAERHMRAAGINVVDTATYFQRFDGYGFAVSLWEGHGDEEAHAIWASLLLPAISAEPTLQKFRR